MASPDKGEAHRLKDKNEHENNPQRVVEDGFDQRKDVLLAVQVGSPEHGKGIRRDAYSGSPCS